MFDFIFDFCLLKDVIIENIGNSEFPWIVEAKITSDNNISLIMQTELAVTNGYVSFTRLGVSDMDDNIKISFEFKSPQGVNTSKFDTSEVVLPPKKSSYPSLSCQQLDAGIKVTENTFFNITLGIVDKKSKLLMPNINWNVYKIYIIFSYWSAMN